MLELVPYCFAALTLVAEAPPTETVQEGADAIEQPAIALTQLGEELHYYYDLRPIFDTAMWTLIEETGVADLLVEVRVVDADEAVRRKQFHHLTVTLEGDAVLVRSGPRSAQRHATRAAFLEAIRKIPGGPIDRVAFRGDQGYLDMVVLVNPVQIFDVAPVDAPREVGQGDPAQPEIGQRLLFDRRAETRSAPLRRP